MNIFYLHEDPKTCAQMHCDKHVVKMIIEYAQLLSTAHRMLDGHLTVGLSKTGRKQTRYVLSDSRESVLYHATHANHPSTKWVRDSYENYVWLWRMWFYLLREYTHRYGKIHKSQALADELYVPPENIRRKAFEQPWRAMPDEFKVGKDSLASYRNYYVGAKARFAKWTKRETPAWFTEMLHTKDSTLNNEEVKTQYAEV